jgi:hypothetical protein
MAEAAGMSWVNLRAAINADPEFPIERRGGNGVEWVFDVEKVLRYMIGRCEAVVAERRDQNSRVARLVGFDVEAAPETATLDVDGLRKLWDLVSQISREKQKQGLLAPIADMRAAAAEYHEVVLEAFLGAVQRIDPTGSMPPTVRAMLENELGNILVRIQDAATAWQEGLGATSQSAAA